MEGALWKRLPYAVRGRSKTSWSGAGAWRIAAAKERGGYIWTKTKRIAGELRGALPCLSGRRVDHARRRAKSFHVYGYLLPEVPRANGRRLAER